MDERLNRFCGDDEGRYELATPWRHDGYDYATDSRIAVRVPSSGSEVAVNTDKDRAKAYRSFGPIPSGEWRWWPMLEPDHDTEPCEACDGTGHGKVKCNTCDGTGCCDCDKCGNEHDCGHCDGEGEVTDDDTTCPVCNGFKTQPGPLVIAGRRISGRYWQVVNVIADVEFLDDGMDCNTVLVFRAPGGLEGRLIPRVWRD